MPANPQRNRGYNTDLRSSDEGGIATFLGDWAEFSGIDNAVGAFLRELTTPWGNAARFNLDVEGLQMLDEPYGNRGYQLLGENLDETLIDEHIKAIEEVQQNHPRLLYPRPVEFEIRPFGGQVAAVFTIPVRPYATEQEINLLLSPYERGFIVAREEGLRT